MNTATWAALVTTGICVGGPALAAAALLAWNRHRVIDGENLRDVYNTALNQERES